MIFRVYALFSNPLLVRVYLAFIAAKVELLEIVL